MANQTAVAIKKIELIERLTEKNLIKDFFEQLAGGAALGDVEGRAARLRCDLDQRHLVLAAAPASDALERLLGAVAPGSLFDRRDDSMRALLRVPRAGEEALVEDIRQLHAEVEPPVAVGVSNACRGAASFRAGFEEARHALLGTTVLQSRPGVMAYDELGPYKYLLRMSIDADVRDAHRDAVARLAEYDLARSTRSSLRWRSSSGGAATSAPRPKRCTSIRTRCASACAGSWTCPASTFARDDWLMVEIALKLVKLEQALGRPGPPSAT